MSQNGIDNSILINKINQLTDLKNNLKRISNNVDEILETGNQYWKGEAADTYYSSCFFLKERLESVSKEISQLSELINLKADLVNNVILTKNEIDN